MSSIILQILKPVLISTYWNVNGVELMPLLHSRRVLISTYWNVNNGYLVEKAEKTPVLISTYWNVNLML